MEQGVRNVGAKFVGRLPCFINWGRFQPVFGKAGKQRMFLRKRGGCATVVDGVVLLKEKIGKISDYVKAFEVNP